MSKVNHAVPMPRFARNFDLEKENAPPSRGAQCGANDVSVTDKSKPKRIIPFFGEPKPQDAQTLNTAKLPKRTPFNVLCSEKNKQTEAVDACKAKMKSDLKPVNVLRIAKTSKIGQSGPNATILKRKGSGLNGATQHSRTAKAKESGVTCAISMREPVRPRLFRSQSVVTIPKRIPFKAKSKSIDILPKDLFPVKNTFHSRLKTISQSRLPRKHDENQTGSQKHLTASRKIKETPSERSYDSSGSHYTYVCYNTISSAKPGRTRSKTAGERVHVRDSPRIDSGISNASSADQNPPPAAEIQNPGSSGYRSIALTTAPQPAPKYLW